MLDQSAGTYFHALYLTLAATSFCKERRTSMALLFTDLLVFVNHPTHGLTQFENVLQTDEYCTVPEALAQTYGVLVTPTLTIPENAEGPPIVNAPAQVCPHFLK